MGKQNDFQRAGRIALGVGAAGLIACLVAALTGMATRTAVMQSYLIAFLFWLALAVGCFSILLLQHVVKGRWGVAVRRLLEAASGTLPLLVVLFLPILLYKALLYPWAGPEAAQDALIAKKAAYLNGTFFTIRAIVYFGVWIGIARYVTLLSRRQDNSGDTGLALRMRKIAAPALVVYSLTVTFAAFDWGMSLEPHWFSTIYGVLYASGAALAGMSLVIVTLSRLADRKPFVAFLKPETVGDLGNLTLTFTMFWTYIAISQFLIIWSGNLPEETPWYWTRMHGGWQYVGIALLTLQFGVPFLLLLSRARKRNIRKLAVVAMWILVMRFVDLLWLLGPAFSPDRFRLTVLDLLAMAGVGGIWTAGYLRNLRAAPLLPVQAAQEFAAAGDAHHE